MERANGDVARRGGSEALADSFLHLLAGVARESQQQQLRRSPESPLDEPAGLGHDDRGLAAAAGGNDEIAAVVERDSPALYLRERSGLDLANRARERFSSFATNASLAFFRASAGTTRNLWMFLSIRISEESDNDCGHRPAMSPAAVRASRTRSPMKSRVMYFGGFERRASRSRLERSAPFRDAKAQRHQATFAVYSEPANARASIRVNLLLYARLRSRKLLI